ncbi:phage tail protein I [Marinomonas shanghaiensis]|uniref:phage tail protein I n=1 Tax=Marinomonas shanghaiensis TaxID=2202418 RepID=UPI003A9481A7
MSQSKLPSTLKTYSVLPDNRSPLERALELALSEALYSIDHPYPELLDAQKTRKEAISTLAAEKQVPIWDTEDTEQVKRNLAGNAWRIRKISGTKAGIVAGLNSLNFDGEVVSWFESGSDPFTFKVIAWGRGGRPVIPENVPKVSDYINDIKSERDTFTVTLAFGLESTISVSGALSRSLNIDDGVLGGSILPSSDLFGGVILSGVSTQVQITDFSRTGKVVDITACSGALKVFGDCRMLVLTDISLRAKI